MVVVQVAAGFVLHVGQVEGELRVGDAVTARIESDRRGRIMANHTMTHVLNYGLREVRPLPFPLLPPSLPNQSSHNCHRVQFSQEVG